MRSDTGLLMIFVTGKNLEKCGKEDAKQMERGPRSLQSFKNGRRKIFTISNRLAKSVEDTEFPNFF